MQNELENPSALQKKLGKDAKEFTIQQHPNSGLYGKYIVSKSNGSQTDPRAEYLVLRIDSYQSDRSHTIACRDGAMGFAFSTCNPDLAKDVVVWDHKWKKYDEENGIVDEGREEKLPFSIGDLGDFFEGFYLPKLQEIEADAENGLFEKVTSDELKGLAMESAFNEWRTAMLCVVMGDPDSENPEL